MKKLFVLLFVLLGSLVGTCEEEATVPPVTAKFLGTRLFYRTCKIGGKVETSLQGLVKAQFRSNSQRFKRPMLHVVLLLEKDGAWKYFDGLAHEQKNAQLHNPSEESTNAKRSAAEQEVNADAWESVVWGDPRHGFFWNYPLPPKAKLIAYRLEIWQDGAVLAEYDSDRSALRRAGVPDDWHLKGASPGKMSYFWPPKAKN